jgi:hypothetical protein
MKRTVIVLAAVVLIALPLSSQQGGGSSELEQTLYELLQKPDWTPEEVQTLIKDEVDWNMAGFQDAETVAACLAYAKQADGEISPEEKVQVALEIMSMAQRMRALGFAESQILRAALNGTREALVELAWLRKQLRSEDGSEAGELIRSRFQEQVHDAIKLGARHAVQTRARAEQDSRPGDLLVPPGPQGPGGQGH